MAEVREVKPGNSGNNEAECIIDCVAFFYEEGNGSENYRSKKKIQMSCQKGRKTALYYKAKRVHLVSL